MMKTENIYKIELLRSVVLQMENLRSQKHTECGKIFAMQAVMADMLRAIREFGKLKEKWTERLPYDSYFTEEEWECMAVQIRLQCVDAMDFPHAAEHEGMQTSFNFETNEEVEYEVEYEFYERPITTVIAPDYFVRLVRAMEKLLAEGYAVQEDCVNDIRHYALDGFYDWEAPVSNNDEARYAALCLSLKAMQEALATLITDIRELLSHPAKEKLEALYNHLLTVYEKRFKAQEQNGVWKKIRDASDHDEKLEMLQVMKDESCREFMESGFLDIKAGSLSASRYTTPEARRQAAYDSFFLPDGHPRVKAVRKYIFFHKSEMQPDQVKAWFQYDLMLKIIAEEMAYKKPSPPKSVPEAKKSAADEMASVLKTVYLPRCYGELAVGYDSDWVESFVDALMTSVHGAALAADWSVDKKRQQVVATVFGLLSVAGAMTCSNAQIARAYKGGEDRTFAKYVGNGRNSDYADWAREYRPE